MSELGALWAAMELFCSDFCPMSDHYNLLCLCVSKCVYHVLKWCNAYTGVGSKHCLLKLDGLGIRHIHQLNFLFAACSHVLKRVTLYTCRYSVCTSLKDFNTLIYNSFFSALCFLMWLV